jgi:hypothetical protein
MPQSRLSPAAFRGQPQCRWAFLSTEVQPQLGCLLLCCENKSSPPELQLFDLLTEFWSGWCRQVHAEWATVPGTEQAQSLVLRLRCCDARSPCDCYNHCCTPLPAKTLSHFTAFTDSMGQEFTAEQGWLFPLVCGAGGSFTPLLVLGM